MAVIGIDLGTSNSAAAVLRGGRPVMIPSAEGVSLGGKAFPSYVAITADGRLAVVPGATHLFKEPGTLQAVAELARDWFLQHLSGGRVSASRGLTGGSWRDLKPLLRQAPSCCGDRAPTRPPRIQPGS